MTHETPTSSRVDRLTIRDFLVALSVTIFAAFVGFIPRTQQELFYFAGDAHESFVPAWRYLGMALREGQWIPMDPNGWTAGNYAAEAALGIFNPVNLLNFIAVSYFDDLALAATMVMVEFLALIALGTYLLARSYGASRAASAIISIAVPFSGFTLFYEAGGWPSGLMAFTWTIHFWWSSRRFAMGHLNPVVPFLFGVLAMTNGNPYGALGLIIVLLGLGIELLVAKRWANLLHLVVVGLCVGASVVLVYTPLLASRDVSVRNSWTGVFNDTFFVPHIGDFVGSSSPTYRPAITTWAAPLENVPSTYFAWFIAPLLPWLRWSSLYNRSRELISVFVIAGIYLAGTLGPSNVWMFRWPLRLIEYLYLSLAVLFAVALSAGLAWTFARRRTIATGLIVFVGAYLSWAIQPDDLWEHIIGAALVWLLVALAVLVQRQHGPVALSIVLVIGTALTVLLQTRWYPEPDGPPVDPPQRVSEVTRGTQGYVGTVLQLASKDGVTTQMYQNGQILFGNQPLAGDFESIVRYTGIGFREFQERLCMDYRGAVCPAAFDELRKWVGPGYDVSLIDALKVSTLVLQNSLLPQTVTAPAPPGWSPLVRDGARTVWLREDPLPFEGEVSWASDDTTVDVVSTRAEREVLRVSAPAQGGDILFSRLAWPGYSATVDGQKVDVVDGPAGLVVVTVPEGQHEVVLTYRSPGQQVGRLILLGATAVILLQTVIWYVAATKRRRRESRRGVPETTDDLVHDVDMLSGR